MTRPAPKVLLLQARRGDDPMGPQEHACFVRRTGLPQDNVVPYDLTNGPPSETNCRAFDALMMGGSGDFYVSKRDLPEFAPLMDFLGGIVTSGFPMFASCFGYQLLVSALDGEIVHDPDNTEVGTYEITLTEAGADDPLLGILPPRLMAQMGHKDRALRHPPGFENLVESERSPLQAFRVPHQPIWATQFHPELDRETNLERYAHYLDGYASVLSEEQRQNALARFHESRETAGLLPRFLSLVFDWPG